MRNTQDKIEFIFDHIEWNWFAMIALSYVSIKYMGFEAYVQSLGAYVCIISAVFIIGIIVEWHEGRNGVNIFIDIIISQGFVAIYEFYKFLKPRIDIIVLISIGITFLVIILLSLGIVKKYTETDMKIKIIKRVSINCFRIGLSLCMLLICIPIWFSILFEHSIMYAPNKDEHFSIETAINGENTSSGLEYTIEDNIELISKINQETWEKINLEEKLEVCTIIANCEATLFGMQNPVKMCLDALGPDTYGEFNKDKEDIALDMVYLASGNSFDVVETVIHEVTHAYQYELVKIYNTLDAKSRRLMFFNDILIYRNEFEHYNYNVNSYAKYYFQNVEMEARAYASCGVNKYFEKVNEYLGIEDEDKTGEEDGIEVEDEIERENGIVGEDGIERENGIGGEDGIERENGIGGEDGIERENGIEGEGGIGIEEV